MLVPPPRLVLLCVLAFTRVLALPPASLRHLRLCVICVFASSASLRFAPRLGVYPRLCVYLALILRIIDLDPVSIRIGKINLLYAIDPVRYRALCACQVFVHHPGFFQLINKWRYIIHP